MKYQQIRQHLYDHVMKGVEVGLIRMSAGNFSVRTDDGLVAITPAAIHYDQLQVEQISIITPDGETVEGPRPSSEIVLHTDIYKAMPHIGAVCHTHSPFALTFAVLGLEIPVITIEMLPCGAPVPVAEWASPGSAKGGRVAMAEFQKRPELRTLLLRNHGALAIGQDLPQAFDLAYNLEVGARIYYQALCVGKPVALTADQVQEVRQVYGL